MRRTTGQTDGRLDGHDGTDGRYVAYSWSHVAAFEHHLAVWPIFDFSLIIFWRQRLISECMLCPRHLCFGRARAVFVFSYRSCDFSEMLRHSQNWLCSDVFGPRFEFFQKTEEGGFPWILLKLCNHTWINIYIYIYINIYIYIYIYVYIFIYLYIYIYLYSWKLTFFCFLEKTKPRSKNIWT